MLLLTHAGYPSSGGYSRSPQGEGKIHAATTLPTGLECGPAGHPFSPNTPGYKVSERLGFPAKTTADKRTLPSSTTLGRIRWGIGTAGSWVAPT